VEPNDWWLKLKINTSSCIYLEGLWKQIKEGLEKGKTDPVWREKYGLNHSSIEKGLPIFVNCLQIMGRIGGMLSQWGKDVLIFGEKG